MGNVLNDTLKTSIIIMAFAAVQIVVHMIYFLHMNTKVRGWLDLHRPRLHPHSRRVTLAGSIWVMYHMDQNMMPMSPHEALSKP
jgi:cytochrome o ubiquinol oxidase operon protein cyoD